MSTNPFACGQLEPLAPELALGILTGDERATALVHLEDCPQCRQLVDDLSAVADDLLLLAPEAEPPIGFEGRTAARIAAAAGAPKDGARRSRRSHRLLLVAAVAFVVGGLLAGSAGWWLGGRGRGTTTVVGPTMRVATVASNGGYSCRALAIGANQAYMYLAVHTSPGQNDTMFRVEAVLTDGHTLPVGTVDIRDNHGAFAAPLSVKTTDLKEMRVYDAAGKLRYHAPFRDPDTRPVTTTTVI